MILREWAVGQARHLSVRWRFLAERIARRSRGSAECHQRHVATDIKRLEDALSAEENLMQQKQLREVLNHSKSDLEDWTAKDQQLQTEEIQAEQQLQTEQDKFTMLDAQLDELVRFVPFLIDLSQRAGSDS